MAARIILTDDMDGTEGAETVQFAFDGVSYRIDLAEKNRDKLAKVLAPFIAKAEVRGNRGNGEAAECRAWLIANGFEVASKGNIPAKLWDVFNSREQ